MVVAEAPVGDDEHGGDNVDDRGLGELDHEPELDPAAVLVPEVVSVSASVVPSPSLTELAPAALS